MSAIFTIARNTSREFLGPKAWVAILIVLLIAFAVTGTSFFMMEFFAKQEMEDMVRTIKGGILQTEMMIGSFFGIIFIILKASMVLSDDRRKGTISILLSKGISRRRLLTGKELGVIYGILLYWGGIILPVLLLGGIAWGIWQTSAALVILLKLLVFGFISLMLSTLLSVPVAVFITIGIFFSISIIGVYLSLPILWLKIPMSLIYYVLPSTDMLSFSSMSSRMDFFYIVLHNIEYAILMFILAVFFFQRRDLFS
jgi:ABC-type transport system involved in multi-copper enzyme maturation permease subunit